MEHKLATSWVREVIVRIVRDMEMPCNIGASAEPHLNPVAAFYLVAQQSGEQGADASKTGRQSWQEKRKLELSKDVNVVRRGGK